MKITDEELERLAQSKQDRIRSLAEECLEARRRGTMPTVDPIAQNRIPTNLADQGLRILEGMLHVSSWTPEPDGRGRPTQVHLVMSLGNNLGVTCRLRSARAVDQLIHVLAEYRNEVWPGYRGLKVKE